MEIVYKENHRPAAIEGHRRRTARHGSSTCGGQLRLFAAAAGRNAIEEGDLARLAVDLEDELIALKTIDKIALLVEDHKVSLDEIGVDADYVIRLLLRQRGEGRHTYD